MSNLEHKKIIGVSMVRNESHIIESFVRHNLEFVDELHIIDHNSSDNTPLILSSLKEEGLPVFIYQNTSLQHNHDQYLTELMHQCVKADEHIQFVLPIDADEFIYANSKQDFVQFLSHIPDDRVGMYTWRGYLSNQLEYNPYFLSDFSEQRKEYILTPKVIIPRALALTSTLYIGNHFLLDQAGNKINSVVFLAENHLHFRDWFVKNLNAEIILTNDFWLGHYPVCSSEQYVKRILEKSVTIYLKDGEKDTAWEGQLSHLVERNMVMPLDHLRTIGFQYRNTNQELQIDQVRKLRQTPLNLKYTHLVGDDTLKVIGSMILSLLNYLRNK